MRIFLLVDCYLPNPISCAKLISDLAEDMSARGNDVTVITADDTLSSPLKVSEESGAHVLRVRTGRLKHPSKVIRAINEIRLSGIVWNSARSYFESHPCDLVVYYSPTIFWAGLVRKLKALHGCGSYLVLRDLFPQWALDAGLLSRYGLPYWYFRRHELALYRTADVIGVQSPADLDYFSNASLLGSSRLEVLFNWAKIESTGKLFGIRRRLGLKDEVIFVYGGRLGVAQDIDNLARLAKSLRAEKDIFFLLIGDGSEAQRIKAEIAREGASNVAVHPPVSQSEFLEILTECDVGLISLSRDLKTQNMTGKVLSYMMVEKPILASVNPGNPLISMIPETGMGLVSINGEDDAFRANALTLAHSAEMRRQMGKNANQLLKEKFNVSTASNQIISHFFRKGEGAQGGTQEAQERSLRH
jgi:glycosyltransferase involved in cell wall biosynthesis